MSTESVLFSAVTALLGVVVALLANAWHSQDKRISKLEAQDEKRVASEQTLRETIVKLTVTVEHLAAQLAQMARTQSNSFAALGAEQTGQHKAPR